MCIRDSPYVALAALLEIFHPAKRPPPGVSPLSVVAGNCTMGTDITVMPGAVIGSGCVIGDRAVLMSGVMVGDGVSLGEDTLLHPNVVVYEGCVCLLYTSDAADERSSVDLGGRR